MQRPAILPRGDLRICRLRLYQGTLFGQRDNKMQLGVIPLQAFDVHLRERKGSDLACMKQARKFTYSSKGEIVQISWRFNVMIRLPSLRSFRWLDAAGERSENRRSCRGKGMKRI